MNNVDALKLISLVQEKYGKFKLNTKFKDEWRALMNSDFTKAAFKPYTFDKQTIFEAWVYCDQVKESYTSSIKLLLVCLGIWRKEIPTINKVNYLYWTQPQKNILCDNIVQKLTFYCTDIYREPLVQRRQDGNIIDNWKRKFTL